MNMLMVVNKANHVAWGNMSRWAEQLHVLLNVSQCSRKHTTEKQEATEQQVASGFMLSCVVFVFVCYCYCFNCLLFVVVVVVVVAAAAAAVVVVVVVGCCCC